MSSSYQHTGNLLGNLEGLEFFSDLRIVCEDGFYPSYRILLGSCSELVRSCLGSSPVAEEEVDAACIILPGIHTWEVQALHAALLAVNESPSPAQLDAVLQMLTTMGVNISPFIDFKIGGNSGGSTTCLEDIRSFCLISEGHLKLDVKEEVDMMVVPQSRRHNKVTRLRNDNGPSNTIALESDSGGNNDLSDNSSSSLSAQCSSCLFCLQKLPIGGHLEAHLAVCPHHSGLNSGQQDEGHDMSTIVVVEMEEEEEGDQELDEGSFNKNPEVSDSKNCAKFSCPVCTDRTFKSAQALAAHTRQAHPIATEGQPRKRVTSGVFKCMFCTKTLSHPSNLKRHIRTAHFEASDGKLYNCETCGKAFKDPSSMRQHSELHLAVRRFPCPICPKSFSQRSQLEAHQRVHSGARPFACNLCNKTFRTLGHVKSHKLNRHIGVKLNKSHICAECGQGFIKEFDLRVHIRKHTGERPFVCLHCGKAFRSERHIEIHNRIHTGEKPYSCGNCARAFVSCSGLRQHFKSHAICRMHATEGAYSKNSFKRRGAVNSMGLESIPELSITEASRYHSSLNSLTVQDLKASGAEETVVYLTGDTELALVGGAGGIIDGDMGTEVNILQLGVQENGEVLSLVEMSENL